MASKKKGSSKPKKVEEQKPEGKPVRHKPKSSSSSIKGLFPRPDQFDRLKGGKTQEEREIRQQRNFEPGQEKIKTKKRGTVKVERPVTKAIERHGPTTIETSVSEYTEHGIGEEGHRKSEKAPKEGLTARQKKGAKKSHKLAMKREPRDWFDQAQLEVDTHERIKKGKRGYPMHFLDPKIQALHREIIHPTVRRHVSHALQIELERRARIQSKEKGHKVNPLHRAKKPIYTRWDHQGDGKYSPSKTNFGPVWKPKESDIHHEINSYYNLHKPMAARKEMTSAQQRKLHDALNYVKENTGHAHTKKLTGKAKLHAETAFGGMPTGTNAEKVHEEVKKYEAASLRAHDEPTNVKAHLEKKNIAKRTPAVKKLSHDVHDVGERHWHKEMNKHRDTMMHQYLTHQSVIEGLKPNSRVHPKRVKLVTSAKTGTTKKMVGETTYRRLGKRGKVKPIQERHVTTTGKIYYETVTHLGEKIKEKKIPTYISTTGKDQPEAQHVDFAKSHNRIYSRGEKSAIKRKWNENFKSYEHARHNWEHHFKVKNGMLKCKRGTKRRKRK